MMNATSSNPSIGPGIQEVDLAVRSVLAACRGGTRPSGSRVDRGVETFAGRLLSLQVAEALPDGLRGVRVAPGTVVTPLARDHLKRRGIEVGFVSRAEVDRLRNTGEWGFAVVEESGHLSAVRRALLDLSEGWLELSGSVEAAAGWVAERSGRGAIVLTGDASVAVYRACQVKGVRAAVASDADGVDRAVRGLGVNVLVVDPAGKSIARVRQLASEFRRGGGPVPPAWLG